MRHKLILSLTTLVFLAGNSQLFAQRGGEGYGGIQGGATLTGFANEYASSDSRWGGTAGLFGGFRPSYGTLVNLEVNWVQKGAEDVRLDYIDVPLTIGGLAPLSSGGIGVGGYIGVSIGFKINCSSDVTALCDSTKGSEWTLPFGLMIVKRSGDKFFGIDARYALGLGDAFENVNAHNKAWLFRAMVGKSLSGGGRR